MFYDHGLQELTRVQNNKLYSSGHTSILEFAPSYKVARFKPGRSKEFLDSDKILWIL